jgi:uncharacterized protein (TIGR02996 family)
VERAEFIRTQILLARPGKLSAAERRRLRRRETELLQVHGTRWLAEVPLPQGVRWLAQPWRRGFPAHCEADGLAVFAAHARALFALAPVEGLFMDGPEPAEVAAFVSAVQAGRLRGLSFYRARRTGVLGAAGLAALVGSPTVAALRWLALQGQQLADEGARALASSPHLRRLRTLDLSTNVIRAEGAAALAGSPFLGRLRSLDLLQNGVGPEGALALARSVRLRSLATINLHGNQQDTAATLALVNGPLAPNLRSLRWGGSSAVGVEAGRAVAEAPALARLRWLDLSNTRIGDAGVMYLAHSPHLTGLRGLRLRSNDLHDGGLAVLARSPLADRLAYLNIENNEAITNVGAWELVRTPRLGKIRRLEMWDVDTPDEPVRQALRARFGQRVVICHSEQEPPALPARGTQEGFLDDIREHPEDDAPRLVYADWLEENGDPVRAEFIRVQCRLAALAREDPEREALVQRQGEILMANGYRWSEEAFLGWLGHPEERCPLHEPHGVCGVFARATRARLGLAETLPAQRQAELEDEVDECGTELERHFNFSGFIAGLPLFRSCSFRCGFLELASVDEFMAYIFLPALRDIGMLRELVVEPDENDPRLGDALVQYLIATLDRPRLRKLLLHTEVRKLATIEALAAWPGAAELTELTGLLIWGEGLGDAALQALARSPYLANLEVLELNVDGYTDMGLDALVRSPLLGRLRKVQLWSDDDELSESALAAFRARFGADHPRGSPP